MMTQPALQTIVRHILPNISWSKCETLRWETWETFFLRNNAQNVGEKLVPDPFLKNENWTYLWINRRKFYTVCFYCMTSWGLSRYNETKLQTTCFHVNLSFFKKLKRGLELVSHDFGEKYFSCYILLIDQISLSGCLYFVGYWEICVLRFLIKQVMTSWILKLTWYI